MNERSAIKIVVGVDGSENSVNDLDWCIRIAAETGAEANWRQQGREFRFGANGQGVTSRKAPGFTDRTPFRGARCPVHARHMDGPPRAPAVVTEGLTKDYGSGRGLFDLTLRVEAGEVFGLIGPNGAGKTTTIRLLMDLARPDRGSATLLGMDAHAESSAIKRSLGYLPGELPTYPRARAGQIIGLLASMRGGVSEDRIAALAERLQLDLSRPYRELSHGNKQKVWLVQAFMHRPRLLILDEPTLGLDPLIQAEFHQIVLEAVRDGATVFLSSHVLSEVQSLCSRMALLSEGRLLRVGTLEQLRDIRVHRLEATYTRDLDAAAVSRLPGVTEVSVSDHHLSCTVRGPVAPLLATLASAEALEIDSDELSLEEIFLATYRKPPS